jgi:hypothetical protein
LIARLKDGNAAHIQGATETWAKLWTYRLVKYLVMACQRYWSYGAIELFRLRHTATLGYLRLQAESMALVVLFFQDDALAYRWAEITKVRANDRQTLYSGQGDDERISDGSAPTRIHQLRKLREDFGRAGLNLVPQRHEGDVPLRPGKDVVVLPFELEKHVLWAARRPSLISSCG